MPDGPTYGQSNREVSLEEHVASALRGHDELLKTLESEFRARELQIESSGPDARERLVRDKNEAIQQWHEELQARAQEAHRLYQEQQQRQNFGTDCQ